MLQAVLSLSHYIEKHIPKQQKVCPTSLTDYRRAGPTSATNVGPTLGIGIGLTLATNAGPTTVVDLAVRDHIRGPTKDAR